MAGECSLDDTELSSRWRVVRGTTDVESVVTGAAGCFHLLASVDGQVYGRGSASQARRLYQAEISGVTVLADRARTLAWLSGARLDVRRLAARLAYPDLPHPVASGALWRDVRALEGAEAAYLDARGGCRVTRWWSAPPGDLSVADGAAALRRALQAAVAVRVDPGQPLGADLSGGLDSTSLCFLAAEAGARLVTATIHWASPGNEDADYAARAAAQLPGVQRLIFNPGDLPSQFTGVSQHRDPADEPSAILRDAAQQRHIVDVTRAAGARYRLSGHGGDHVVEAPAGYMHRLVRRHPAVGLRHAAGYRAGYRWTRRATVRALFDSRSYRTWLSDSSSRLRPSENSGREPDSWGTPVALPPWASEQAFEQLTGLCVATRPRLSR